MSRTILIASLGDHPAVVTRMVTKLQTEKKITFDEIIILHANGSKGFITLGYDLIEEILGNRVRSVPLDFDDPVTYEDSLNFLRVLATTLDMTNKADVYLSLAGGRKNMSALMAVIYQFYPNVKGLYHLIDNSHEGFHSISELIDMPKEKQLNSMECLNDKIELVELPFQPFFKAVELRDYFKQVADDDEGTVKINEQVKQFFRAIFQSTHLQVSFTETAWKQAQELADEGGERATNFFTCFRQMSNVTLLKGRIHGTFKQKKRVFHFYKRPKTAERPFYYTTPNFVHLYDEEKKTPLIEKVVICGLSVEIGKKGGQDTYDPPAEKLLAQDDFEPHKNLTELKQMELAQIEKILLVPLGESPMVATQTYALLNNVATVALIYPKRNGDIKNGADWIQEVFEERKITCKKIPIEKLADVTSTENCRTYLTELLKAIEQLRIEYPDKEVVLSLSGGRKGMSALTLFAAQQAKVKWVYHTLITDHNLEEKVIKQTEYKTLKFLDIEEQINRLFLTAYENDKDKFTLFPIPVISFT